MNISENKSKFIDDMIRLKDEIEDTLKNKIYTKEIEKLRSGYEGRFSKERFKEYLVKKTTLHIIFKYIFIRMMTEGQRLVSSKLNVEGIDKWNDISKNYRKDYFMLFNIASEDLRRDEQSKDFLEPCIYDTFLDRIENDIFNKVNGSFIENFKNYDFRTLDPNTAVSLFDNLYSSEDRVNLQGFLEESKITTYLMKSLGLL